MDVITCPYGMSYVWISDDVLLAGIVVGDDPRPTVAARKKRRTERQSTVRGADVRRAVERVRNIEIAVESELRSRKQRIMNEYISSQKYRDEMLAELQPLVKEASNQTHDFIALLKQIRANVMTIFESRFPGLSPEDAADRLENEGAIFFATELMMGKIDAMSYLREPNLIFGRETRWALHRFLSKYIKVYRSFARQRELDFFVAGISYGEVEYNSEAVGAVVHALLDNLVKYAPPSSKVDVIFSESDSEIEVKFAALGPRIHPDETEKIFQLGYRGRAAETLGPTGMGFGLAAARVVSDALGLRLTVDQSDTADPAHPLFHQTEFGLRFLKEP